jgi:hypothetical protein
MTFVRQTCDHYRSGRWQQQMRRNIPESLSDFSRSWNKTTSKPQTEGKEKPSQSLAKHLETCQELTKSTTAQRHTYPTIHPSQNLTKGSTGQTGGRHRSDRSRPRHSGSHNLPDLLIRSTNSHKTLGILGVPHGHPIATIWSTKTS